MTAQVLVSTANMSHEEWLQWRRRGIGGSDAAAIAGLSPWKSSVAVWLEKTGQVEPPEPGEEAYWGTVLEDVVAREFSLRTGLKVRRRNAILQHQQYEWMIANIDREVVGVREGLECKTTSAFNAGEWKNDEIPAPYIVQCQHYMAVTGYSAWWIAVLIGGNKFVYKRIERDDELIEQLIELEKDFWENHVMKNVPPEMDGSAASTELVKKMYPEAKLPEIDLPSEAKTLIEALEQVNSEIKELETRKNEYENRLKAMLGEHEAGRVGDRLVTWKNITSNRFDSKRFEKEHPELYKQYLKQTTYRKFAVK